eukprot:CAMPEP_0194770384 /NCGR_PEP_ID=MMETSP0323_2-20130528/46063_1 /TAXON_ID=2866 ORGANISM="Crypthecodinium cohnii, Strain Seligo" /NCGR_SAMPLE_ID=MMETSP0323_2 /ASSEMBLY_ACC=CAM_ASM_000346 /LENGTH=46 /DNA_ID= /DNA_START= /DNA_END= /DNA_ORIENTATION=
MATVRGKHPVSPLTWFAKASSQAPSLAEVPGMPPLWAKGVAPNTSG